MSAKRLATSLVYGIVTGFGFMFLTGSYIEQSYIGQQLAEGNMGPAFNWLSVCILVGIACLIIGLFGKLPGTK